MSVLRWPQRPAPDAAAFNADDTLLYADPPRVRWLKRFAAIVSTVTYAAYLVYRARYTLNPEAPVFAGLMYFAEVHGFLSLLFYFHQCTTLRRRDVPPPPEGMRVDVFITTYNEELDLLRQTIRGAVAMRYPHRTFVLDDGGRPAVRALADELGAHYITRSDRAHAKAGNWNNAFRQTDADFIATFDADHVPRPAFLERTLGFFRDPRVAFVQVPQQYHNLDSVQHRVNWQTRRMYGEQDVFFNLVMPGKDNTNSAFFCGTGAVLRRSALAKHGGIVTGTITEDLHTSIVLHSEGWKSVYLNEMLVTGLAPMDLRSFEIQRLRWAEGNLKTVALINPLTCPGLSLNQRVNYVASLYHWTIGVPKLIYYLGPPWMLFSHTFPISNFDGQFLAIYFAFLASLLFAYEVISSGTGWLLMDEVFNMASFFTMLRAIKRAVLGRGAGTFEVTSKLGGEVGLLPLVPHLGLLGFSFLALSWSWWGLGFGVSDDVFGASVASFWTLYNMGLVYAVVKMGLRPSQKRRVPRFRAHFPVEVPGREGMVGMTGDISETGCTLLWSGRLPLGAHVPIEMHLGTLRLNLVGVVRSRHGVKLQGWQAHGMEFEARTQAQKDLLNDAIFQFVVPSLFRELSVPWVPGRLLLLIRGRLQHKRHAQRHFTHVPIGVVDGSAVFLATTMDESSGGIGFVSPRPLTPGAQIAVTVFGPGGARQVEAVVQRCQALATGDAFPSWLIGVRFDRTLFEARLPAEPGPSESVA